MRRVTGTNDEDLPEELLDGEAHNHGMLTQAKKFSADAVKVRAEDGRSRAGRPESTARRSRGAPPTVVKVAAAAKLTCMCC